MEVGFQRQDGEVILKQKRQKKRKARTISPHWVPLVAQRVKRLLALRETWVRSLSQEDPLEEGMATHSTILSWRIPMDRGAWGAIVHGSQRVGYD